jgi:alkylhydroperoxidase/carboxymuconolactone decarboxylase family protein YurZ
MKTKLIAFLLTVAAAGAMFAYGVYREEIGEVMFNAAML